MKIYRKSTMNHILFWLDITLPADNLLIFRKNLVKMTLIDGLKILDDKIKANWAQYDIDREAVKNVCITI